MRGGPASGVCGRQQREFSLWFAARLHLYRNLGGLRFEDVTAKAGLGHTGWGQGVSAGDIDNDGNVDLTGS